MNENLSPGQRKAKRWQGSKWSRREKRLAIYQRDNHQCVYCGSDKRLTLDHVKPRSKGGSNARHNLVTACISCNSARAAGSFRCFVIMSASRLGVDWRAMFQALKNRLRLERKRERTSSRGNREKTAETRGQAPRFKQGQAEDLRLHGEMQSAPSPAASL